METQVFIAGKDIRQTLTEWMGDVVDLYLEKREQYGDSFTDSAVQFKAADDDEKEACIRLFLQRQYDKLKRIHTTVNGKKKTAKDDEVIEDALKDIIGYVCVIRAYLLKTQGK